MVILSHSFFSNGAMAEFKCGYCNYSSEQFDCIIGHAVNSHTDKEILFLKRKRHSERQYNPIRFPIKPANEHKNGRNIIPNKDKLTVTVVPDLENTNPHPRKKLKTEHDNGMDQPQSVNEPALKTTDEKSCQTEDVFIIDMENLLDKEKMFLQDIKDLFPLAIQYLHEYNQLAAWILFFKCLANKRLPFDNVS